MCKTLEIEAVSFKVGCSPGKYIMIVFFKFLQHLLKVQDPYDFSRSELLPPLQGQETSVTMDACTPSSTHTLL